MAKYFYSPKKQKVLMLLASGFVLGFSRSPNTHKKIWKSISKAWKEIDRITLRRIVNEFKYKRLVDFREEKDGSVSIVLTKLGEHHALRYNPEKLQVLRPVRWDKKWRVVTFDIPEKKKQARAALRWELKKLGFVEFQRSVWIFPYECRDAIDFIIELFEIRDYVRYLVVSEISYDADIRLKFNLA